MPLPSFRLARSCRQTRTTAPPVTANETCGKATLCGCSYLQKLWPRTFIGSRESTVTIVTAVTPVASMLRRLTRHVSTTRRPGYFRSGRRSATLTRSPSRLNTQIGLCGSCHQEALETYQASVHGHGLEKIRSGRHGCLHGLPWRPRHLSSIGSAISAACDQCRRDLCKMPSVYR